MNYYYETGHIGSYKGHEVWITDYKDFCKEDTINNNTIWAVRIRPEQDIKLVFRGSQIGTMSHDGEVSLFNRDKPFNFYCKPKETPTVVKTAVEVEAEEVPMEINYSDYTQPVDTFFKNLKSWWEDLDKELKSI